MKECLVCGNSDLYQKIYDHHAEDIANVNVSECSQLIDRLVPSHYIFKGTVMICRHCGYGMLENIPSLEQLNDYYQRLFWKQSSLAMRPDAASEGQISLRHQARAARQAEFILQYLDAEHLCSCLEIGAGDALLSIELQKHAGQKCRFDVCEPGESWQEYYQRNGMRHVACFFPFQSANPYQLIVASHWLEHVRQPIETLQQMMEIVEPGGYIMIEVPNTAHNYWQLPLKDTPHISFFTCESLKQIALAAGLQIVAIDEFGITIDQHFQAVLPDYNSLGPAAGGYSVAAVFKKI